MAELDDVLVVDSLRFPRRQWFELIADLYSGAVGAVGIGEVIFSRGYIANEGCVPSRDAPLIKGNQNIAVWVVKASDDEVVTWQWDFGKITDPSQDNHFPD
jgi:hypothetical protein